MKLYFENSLGERRVIATPESEKDAFKEIKFAGYSIDEEEKKLEEKYIIKDE